MQEPIVSQSVLLDIKDWDKKKGCHSERIWGHTMLAKTRFMFLTTISLRGFDMQIHPETLPEKEDAVSLKCIQ